MAAGKQDASLKRAAADALLLAARRQVSNPPWSERLDHPEVTHCDRMRADVNNCGMAPGEKQKWSPDWGQRCKREEQHEQSDADHDSRTNRVGTVQIHTAPNQRMILC